MTRFTNLGDILRLPALAGRPAFLDLRRPESPLSLTAHELDAAIVAVARGLIRRRIRVGDRIGILAENRLEFLITYLGAMRMGAIAVPVNFKLPAPTIAHIFRDSSIDLAFADAKRAAQVPTDVPSISYDAEGEF